MDSVQSASGTKGASIEPMCICPNCGAYVIAATWSERVSEKMRPQRLVLRGVRLRI